MLEHSIVFAIVAAATSYAAWKLMPRTLRATLARKLVHLVASGGSLAPERRASLETRLAGGGGCSGCDTCKGCGSGNPATDATQPAGIRVAPAARIIEPEDSTETR